MTREKEILKAYNEQKTKLGNQEHTFMRGAKWADAHPHWISVEDELPNNYEPVIAAFDRHFARVCFHCGDTWYLDNPPVVEPMSGITHWLPLPQPPKKGGEK